MDKTRTISNHKIYKLLLKNVFFNTYKNLKPERNNKKNKKTKRNKNRKNKRIRESRNRKNKIIQESKKNIKRKSELEIEKETTADLTNKLSIIPKEILLPHILENVKQLIKQLKEEKKSENLLE